MWTRIRSWARQLQAETLALWFCCKHPSTPLAAKVLASCVVAYALSPIDLIPDFIPVLGYLDDIILLPVGIYFTLKLIPREVLDECRGLAADWLAARHARPRNYVAAGIIAMLWLATALFAWNWLRRHTGE